MKLPNRQTDPSGLFAAVGGFAAAVLSLAAVWMPLPPGLTEAVMGVIATGGAVWTALAIRRDAWSPLAHFREMRQVEGMTSEDGDVDRGAVLTVLLIVLVVVVLIRVL